MAFDISYIYKVVDKFSGPLAKMSNSALDFGAKIEKANDKIRKLDKSLEGVRDGAMNAGRSLSLYVGAPMLLLAKQSVGASMRMEALTMKMNAAVGTAELGAAQIERLRKEADEMGLSFESAAEGFASWATAATRSGFNIKQTEDIFRSFSKVAVSLKLSPDRMERIFYALTQMSSRYRVSMEELSQQLGDHLPGAIAIAAKSMGKTAPEFLKLVENGKIIATELIPAMAYGVEAELAKSYQKSTQSTQSNLNRFTNAVFYAQIALANSGLIEVMLSITNVIVKLANAFSNLSPKMQKFIAYAVIGGILIGPLLIGLSSLLSIIPLLILSFKGLAAIMLFIAANPLVALTSAIVFFSSTVLIVKNWEKVCDVFSNLYDLVGKIVEKIKKIPLIGLGGDVNSAFKKQVNQTVEYNTSNMIANDKRNSGMALDLSGNIRVSAEKGSSVDSYSLDMTAPGRTFSNLAGAR